MAVEDKKELLKKIRTLYFKIQLSKRWQDEEQKRGYDRLKELDKGKLGAINTVTKHDMMAQRIQDTCAEFNKYLNENPDLVVEALTGDEAAAFMENETELKAIVKEFFTLEGFDEFDTMKNILNFYFHKNIK